jgi:predicted 3-demethylubiquinone-9 3-methyltransferase (glyoxalase superfamily)
MRLGRHPRIRIEPLRPSEPEIVDVAGADDHLRFGSIPENEVLLLPLRVLAGWQCDNQNGGRYANGEHVVPLEMSGPVPAESHRESSEPARPLAERTPGRNCPLEHTNMKPKNTICLWFDKDAHEAARFYAATFPDSEVTAVHKAPGDYPSGKEGDVLTVEFTVLGIPCLGLNGGPEFRHSEAFSFQIATDNQAETDRYWNAIVGNGGQESQCGWCKDRWGLSWQITPRTLTDALAAGGGEAKRAFAAMMPMKKIDIATIEAARRG